MKKPRVRIIDYKVVEWVDPERQHKLYGVAVLVAGGTGWAYLETARKPTVDWKRAGAEKTIADMKRRRTRSGYKRDAKRR